MYYLFSNILTPSLPLSAILRFSGFVFLGTGIRKDVADLVLHQDIEVRDVLVAGKVACRLFHEMLILLACATTNSFSSEQ